MIEKKPSATSPEMVCINCRHYDTIWFNCKFLGFDGIRESPNMSCNVEVDINGVKQFAFEMRSQQERNEEEELLDKFRGDEPVDLP